MNLTVKQLVVDDMAEFTEMLWLFKDVFELKDFQMPGKNYLKKLLERNDFIVYAAILENNVIGGLTAHTLPSYYFQSCEVYIYDLAVKTTFQRKGVGKKLLQALTEYCRRNNYREFFVQADEADTHAVEFYRSTGGSPEKVVHFNYSINE